MRCHSVACHSVACHLVAWRHPDNTGCWVAISRGRYFGLQLGCGAVTFESYQLRKRIFNSEKKYDSQYLVYHKKRTAIPINNTEWKFG